MPQTELKFPPVDLIVRSNFQEAALYSFVKSNAVVVSIIIIFLLYNNEQWPQPAET